MPISTLTADNLSGFIDNNEVAVIDFWAQWCAPCLSFADVYETVAKQYSEVAFGKVDIEANPDVSNLFQVQSIPHLVIFKQGIAIYSESGSMPKSAFIDLIEQAIAVDMSSVKAEIDAQDEDS